VNLNIAIEQPDKKLALFGSADRHLRMIRDTFGVQIVGGMTSYASPAIASRWKRRLP
jgi:hypothetical protein